MATRTFDVREIADLRNVAGQGLVAAVFRVLSDFFFGVGKPWYYYAGAFTGATAAATGIDGATATIYGAAELFEAYVFKSPSGGEAKIFLDGVQQGVIDLYATSEAWELVQLVVDPVGTVFRRVDLENVAIAGLGWFAISSFVLTSNTGIPDAQGRSQTMAYDTIVFRLRDAEANTGEVSVPVNIPTGFTLAEMQNYAALIGPQIDAATESAIVAVQVTVNLNLPPGVKSAPIAGAYNERGGLITFDTSGPRADSFRIPAIRKTIMPGDDFPLTDTVIAALVTRLTTATGAPAIQPRTTQDYEFETARKGSKSLRK